MTAFNPQYCKFQDRSCFKPKDKNCTNGGGVVCQQWCKQIDLELFGEVGAARLLKGLEGPINGSSSSH